MRITTVTIRDVAAKSGYSITTVSRALNGYNDVNEETRAHIFRVAEELNYQPNRVAQQLVTKKFSTIGLFFLARATFRHPFISDIISGMTDEASRFDLDVLLFGSQALLQAREVQQRCLQRGVGGAVISGLRLENPIITEFEKSNFPVVMIDIPLKGRRATFVSSDNTTAAQRAVEALIDLGHRHIGFVNGHAGAWVSYERRKGYDEAVKKYGLPWRPEYVYDGDFSKESGRKGARSLVERNAELTALFVASDLMATGAMEELTAMGYDIPADFSVMGFDDQEFSLHTRPALSTVHQDMYGMGKEAAHQIITMLADPSYIPEHQDLPATVVLRESTGPVPVRSRKR